MQDFVAGRDITLVRVQYIWEGLIGKVVMWKGTGTLGHFCSDVSERVYTMSSISKTQSSPIAIHHLRYFIITTGSRRHEQLLAGLPDRVWRGRREAVLRQRVRSLEHWWR